MNNKGLGVGIYMRENITVYNMYVVIIMLILLTVIFTIKEEQHVREAAKVKVTIKNRKKLN